MSISRKRIVLLAGDVSSLPYVYHALAAEHDVVRVVVEEKEPRVMFLKRRAERLGWWTVIGQLLFVACLVPLLTRAARRRVRALMAQYHLDGAPVEPALVTRVRSVNSAEVVALLQAERPDVVVLHGTRIVGRKVLAACSAQVLNIHAGLTPMYRGVHGGYWALAGGHPELFGVTVHTVDPGIDTGAVLAQKVSTFASSDNFATYPLIQLCDGLALLSGVLKGEVPGAVFAEAPFSALWYHPTLWGYLWTRLRHGVR